MGLASQVRKAVKRADKRIAGLQVSVTHQAWTGQDGDGKPTFGAAVPRRGVLSYSTESYRGRDGHEKVSTAQLMFLSNVRVDERDQITLPDGTTPAIGRVTGPADAGNAGAVYVTKVWFGDGNNA